MKNHKRVSSHHLSLYELEGKIADVIEYLKKEEGMLIEAGWVEVELVVEYGSYGDSDYLCFKGWRPMTESELAAAKRERKAEKERKAKIKEEEEILERIQYEALKKKFEGEENL